MLESDSRNKTKYGVLKETRNNSAIKKMFILQTNSNVDL